MIQACITEFSTRPNKSLKSDSLKINTNIIKINEKTIENMSNCPEARFVASFSLRPIYWLMTTAPPDAKAVNKYMNTVLNELTRETPDTALSPTKLTINVSTIPTNMTNSCSKNNGIIIFFKSLFVNVISYLLVLF